MLDDPADLFGTLIQPFFFYNIQDGKRSRTSERASRICAPEFPGAAASSISARPMTPLSGNPAASDLDTVIKSGTASKCSIAKYVPVLAKPV